MVLAALIYTHPDETYLVTALRRSLLLFTTWIAAYIFNVLCDIQQAVEAHLKPRTAPPAASTTAAPPRARTDGLARADRPTLQAGFSCPKVAAGSKAAHAWADLSAESFNVRCGPNYARNGKKAPSAAALGDVVAVDTFISEKKIFDFLALNHIELPEPSRNWKETYPEFVVINQMLATNFHNSMFTDEKTDGETMHLIVYVRLKPNLAPGYETDQEPQNAEELLKRFLLRADQEPDIAHCFKEIGVVRNLEELGAHLPSSLMSLFRKFNGKPVLTRPEHFFHRDPAGRYFGIDLDAHRYKYMTRTAVHKALGHVERVALGYGYVVEARKEPELPECMLCSCEILMLQKSRAVKFPPPPAGY